MKVALGQLARKGLEAQLGPDVEEGVRTALLRYADSLESGSDKPLAFPRFRRQQPAQASALDLELCVEAELEAALAGEVSRQGIALEQLAEHAVLLCLADLDRATAA